MTHLQVGPGGSLALDEVLDATPLSLQEVLQWPDCLRREREGAQGLPDTGSTGLWHHSPCWPEREMLEPGLPRSCASHPKGKGPGPPSAAHATGHPGLACSLSSWWHQQEGHEVAGTIPRGIYWLLHLSPKTSPATHSEETHQVFQTLTQTKITRSVTCTSGALEVTSQL